MLWSIALLVLGFSIGYMIGYRDGKQFVKTRLNELYGKFGSSSVGFWCGVHSGVWVTPSEMCHLCIAHARWDDPKDPKHEN